MPFANGGLYSRRMMLGAELSTHKFPPASNAMPNGLVRPVNETEGELEVKPGWPITNEASIPLLNGGMYSRTLF
jgi:hypothetical protein